VPEQQVIPDTPDLHAQKHFWNGWIAETLQEQNLCPSSSRPAEAAVNRLQALNLTKPNILEVGCANGWLAGTLAQVGPVTGIDLADEAISVAKARHPELAFIADDFLTAALPVEHFDVVVSLSVISYFADQVRFVSRIHELLKSRGYLILTCPHRFVWERTDFPRRSKGEIPLKWLNPRDLKTLFRDRFSLMSMDTIVPAGNRGILRLTNSQGLNKLLQTILPEPRIVRLKERLGLGKTLVVVAQKRV
jgi:2-polyprenyl-3-methyl-5-hydroxy-6-metoxy-1,4-benzoquinol methylase